MKFILQHNSVIRDSLHFTRTLLSDIFRQPYNIVISKENATQTSSLNIDMGETVSQEKHLPLKCYMILIYYTQRNY